MNDCKKKVKITVFIGFIVFICFAKIYKINKQNQIIADIPNIREYAFDLISLSKIDMNNYSIDANFKENYANKTSEAILSESLTFKYINEHDNNKLRTKESRDFVNKLSILLKDIHILQIEFIKENLIPLSKIEEESELALNIFLENVDKNKENLSKEIQNVEIKIESHINEYISFLNKYNISLEIAQEKQKYEEYFNNEYSDFLDKQLNSKLETLLIK